jgi:hypothetical protein
MFTFCFPWIEVHIGVSAMLRGTKCLGLDEEKNVRWVGSIEMFH